MNECGTLIRLALALFAAHDNKRSLGTLAGKVGEEHACQERTKQDGSASEACDCNERGKDEGHEDDVRYMVEARKVELDKLPEEGREYPFGDDRCYNGHGDRCYDRTADQPTNIDISTGNFPQVSNDTATRLVFQFNRILKE